jgi:hypothetical protein
MQIRVRDVEQPGVEAEPEPRIVERELDVVGVLADDELLAGATAKLALLACLFLCELLFRSRNET